MSCDIIINQRKEPFTVTSRVAKCVPRQEAFTVTRMVSKVVPRQVAYEVCRMVPVQNCCPSAPCAGCAPSGLAGCASGDCASGNCNGTAAPYDTAKPIPEPAVNNPQPTEQTGPARNPMPLGPTT